MKLILDTDIGGDIDDAIALGYLLNQPRCELLGIATVGGEPALRAAIASAICTAAGRADLPIHVGASAPLLGPERQPDPYQFAAICDRWPHQCFDHGNTAIDWMRRTIRANPGEITLLAIGPLTNVGLLFMLDPDIPALLRDITIMGGSFAATEAEQEWNIICDPHAAARVFAAPVMLSSVGFDVTALCRLSAAEWRRRMGGAVGAFEPVLAMAELFFERETPELTLHDPLAAALVFEPSLCRTTAQGIDVELRDETRFGRTLPHADASRPQRVATDVNRAAFFDHLFATVGAT